MPASRPLPALSWWPVHCAGWAAAVFASPTLPLGSPCPRQTFFLLCVGQASSYCLRLLAKSLPGIMKFQKAWRVSEKHNNLWHINAWLGTLQCGTTSQAYFIWMLLSVLDFGPVLKSKFVSLLAKKCCHRWVALPKLACFIYLSSNWSARNEPTLPTRWVRCGQLFSFLGSETSIWCQGQASPAHSRPETADHHFSYIIRKNTQIERRTTVQNLSEFWRSPPHPSLEMKWQRKTA